MRLSKERFELIKNVDCALSCARCPLPDCYNKKELIDEIEALQQENEQLKADIRGKDNEINDLKALVEYLRKFKPKKNEAVMEGSV